MSFRVSVVLILFVCGCGPSKDEWWENIETNERVKVNKVGPGWEMVEILVKWSKETRERRSPYVISYIIYGDSALVTSGECVQFKQMSFIPGSIPIFTYHIYSTADFEEDFRKVK